MLDSRVVDSFKNSLRCGDLAGLGGREVVLVDAEVHHQLGKLLRAIQIDPVRRAEEMVGVCFCQVPLFLEAVNDVAQFGDIDDQPASFNGGKHRPQVSFKLIDEWAVHVQRFGEFILAVA